MAVIRINYGEGSKKEELPTIYQIILVDKAKNEVVEELTSFTTSSVHLLVEKLTGLQKKYCKKDEEPECNEIILLNSDTGTKFKCLSAESSSNFMHVSPLKEHFFK